MDVPHYVSPVKMKEVSYITILKRGKRYYKMRVKNQVQKNYLPNM